ncbi:MAG TPA: FG-GAP-like repeat-containing protein [Saprospiraceae bacterium]|nr:FG-GAP-like repeat-containing protein [Saprospiraceae bacterium]HPI08780.1 FG-GAP-like repeat-containing protein [Saprospiraceae bacterium]
MIHCIRILLFLGLAANLHAQISFQPYQVISSGSSPQSAAIADFNQDGRNDLAVMTWFTSNPVADYKLLIFYQNEQRLLDTAVVVPAPQNFQGNRSMIARDLNGDLLPDIVFIYQDSVGIFYGAPSGGFLPVVSLYAGTSASAHAIGDLNHDSRPDIAVANENEQFITLFLGATDNSFVRTQIPSMYGNGRDMEIADFNGDERDDLAFISSTPPGGFNVIYQQENGGFSAPVFFQPTVPNPFPSTPYSLGVGDLNGDQKMDLVSTSPWNLPYANLNIWMQGDNGISNQPIVRAAYDIPEPVEVADMTCDGKNEIVVLNGGWLRMSVYNGDTPGFYDTYTVFELPYSTHYSTTALALGDLNGDGMKDVAIAGQNQVSLLYNNGPKSVFQPISVTNSLQDFIVTTETDTIFTIPSTFIRTRVDTIDYVRLVYTDSLLATQYWVQTLTHYDSVLLHQVTTCAGTQTDTLHAYYSFSENSLSGIDTTLLATQTDSFFLPRPVVPLTYELFPNPNNGEVFLKFSNPLYLNYFDIDLFAADGKRVGADTYHYEWLNARLLRLDFRNFSAGYYVLRFRSDKISLTEKLIKADN